MPTLMPLSERLTATSRYFVGSVVLAAPSETAGRISEAASAKVAIAARKSGRIFIEADSSRTRTKPRGRNKPSTGPSRFRASLDQLLVHEHAASAVEAQPVAEERRLPPLVAPVPVRVAA